MIQKTLQKNFKTDPFIPLFKSQTSGGEDQNNFTMQDKSEWFKNTIIDNYLKKEELQEQKVTIQSKTNQFIVKLSKEEDQKRITQHHFNFSLIDSTMKIADFMPKKYIETDSSFLYQAQQQFQGQGQKTNSWVSPLGNCYVTYVVPFDIQKVFCASQLATLAVSYSLELYIAHVLEEKFNELNKNKQIQSLTQFQTLLKQIITMKWINDVFMNGKKICGVLTVSEVCGNQCSLSIGIGVNLNNSPIETSTCLKKELENLLMNTMPELCVDTYIQFLSQEVYKLIFQIEKYGFTSVIPSVQRRLQYIGEQVCIYDEKLENQLSQGIFVGINEYGHAMLAPLNYMDLNEEEQQKTEVKTAIEGRMRLKID